MSECEALSSSIYAYMACLHVTRMQLADDDDVVCAAEAVNTVDPLTLQPLAETDGRCSEPLSRAALLPVSVLSLHCT